MKKKNKVLLVVAAGVIILGMGGYALAKGESENQELAVQQQIEARYVNGEGVIHAYPNNEESEYLSESIGLYLQYLLLVGDAGGFQEQVDILETRFLIEKDGSYFVPWRLYEEANVNALIDDVRIAAVLQHAAQKFGEPKYEELGNKLIASIDLYQHRDEKLVDYYDWSYRAAGNRLTLSYLIPEIAVHHNSFELLDTGAPQRFFPEFYDFDQQDYVASNEVHMIDQLLIAINRWERGLDSPVFNEWLVREWNDKGQLAGRFERSTGTPTVDYESLAVYFYLWDYFKKIGQPVLAAEASARADAVAAEELMGDIHFFDYIHYQMMKASE